MIFDFRIAMAVLVLAPGCAWAATVTDYCDTRAKAGGFEIVCNMGQGPVVQNVRLGGGNYTADTFTKARMGDVNAIATVGQFYQFVRRDYAAAIAWFHKAADAGNTDGMVLLGSVYTDFAPGAPKDSAEALKWFTAAADKGNTTGMFYAGNVNAMQLKNRAEAERWYEMAIAHGNLAARGQLINDYQNGINGFPKDPAKVVAFHRASVKDGISTAFFYLGQDYERGYGVEQSDAVAVDWYRKGVAVNEPNAMAALSQLYRQRRGVAKDDAEAARLFNAVVKLHPPIPVTAAH